jgi:hypothetical protein
MPRSNNLELGAFRTHGLPPPAFLEPLQRSVGALLYAHVITFSTPHGY